MYIPTRCENAEVGTYLGGSLALLLVLGLFILHDAQQKGSSTSPQFFWSSRFEEPVKSVLRQRSSC